LNNALVFLHLSLIDGIGPVTIKKLVQHKPDGMAWSDLYNLHVGEVMHRFGVFAKIAQKIVAGLADQKLLDQEIALIEKHDVHFVTLGSDKYPELLSHIHAPPPVLYFLGQPIINEPKTIAIIGSRKAHRYGEQVIEQLVPPLVVDGWVIVSGGAIGADSMAHHQTVKVGGKTVVVLGSGLLRPYPSSNRHLFKEVLRTGGALVSAFPLMTEARPGNFPARNRIIAGLSRGCVVVQAAEKSGARITAQFALEQGRDVFAIPGQLGDPLSVGCHRLIQEGAKLISGVQDIFEEYQFLPHVDKITKVVTTNNEPSYHFVRPAKKKQVAHTPQEKIMHACAAPTSIDDLSIKLELDMAKLQELLFDLQLAGQVQQNFAGLWECA